MVKHSTPVASKSLSFVQMGALSIRASARRSASAGSRPRRRNARASTELSRTCAHGTIANR